MKLIIIMFDINFYFKLKAFAIGLPMFVYAKMVGLDLPVKFLIVQGNQIALIMVS